MFGLFSSSEKRAEVTINQTPKEMTVEVKGTQSDDTQDVVDMAATAFRDRVRNGLDTSEDNGEIVLREAEDGVYRY